MMTELLKLKLEELRFDIAVAKCIAIEQSYKDVEAMQGGKESNPVNKLDFWWLTPMARSLSSPHWLTQGQFTQYQNTYENTSPYINIQVVYIKINNLLKLYHLCRMESKLLHVLLHISVVSLDFVCNKSLERLPESGKLSLRVSY